MKSHSFKLALRNLLKHKSFTLINLSGLATSLAACIIILTYYAYEISFDKHIPDSERTYRIITRLGEGKFWSQTFACYGDALTARPEVEKFTSFIYTKQSIINVGETDFTISESVIADTAFIDFFDIEIVSGRKEDLGQPNNVFITQEMAKIFFPGENPLGRDIFLRQLEGNTADSIGHYSIAGIVKPLPDNTHFGYNMIFSQQGHLSGLMSHLKGGKFFGSNVYVRLYPDVKADNLETNLTPIIAPLLDGTHGPPLEAFNSRLQPVNEIHFTTDINKEPRPVTRKSMIYILLSIGLLILVLLTMNFISTVIVQAHQQRKETGIMQTLGANKIQLFNLSLIKIALFVGLGLLISWVMIALMDPYLKSLFGFGWSFKSLSSHIFLSGLGAGFVVIIFAALGMHLSGTRVSTEDLLRGKSVPSRRTISVFGLLTIIQFAIVVVLIGFSIMIQAQVRYMENKDLGYSEENIYVVSIPAREPRGSFLVEEIKKQAGVITASTAHHLPGGVFMDMDFAAGEEKYQFSFGMVDPGVFETLEIGLINRFRSLTGSTAGWVINETFYNNLLQDFSPEDIAASNFSLGENDLDDSRSPFIISGVMEDFHYSSLYNSIGNFAFLVQPPGTRFNRWLMIRFMEGQSEIVLGTINTMMENYFPGKGYELFLLEDNLKKQYGASHNLSEVIRGFTILSILIAVFGLYGLSLFITQKRTKEIGIRKIYGASSRQIMSMLNKGFFKWIGIAYIIAWPLTIWALKKWLINFAFKAPLPWWIFTMSAFLMVGIAMLAVSWKTSAAANSNPVDAIRQE